MSYSEVGSVVRRNVLDLLDREGRMAPSMDMEPWEMLAPVKTGG